MKKIWVTGLGLLIATLKTPAQTCPHPKANVQVHVNNLFLRGVRMGNIASANPKVPTLSAGFSGMPDSLSYGLGHCGLWVAGVDTGGIVRASGTKVPLNPLSQEYTFTPGPVGTVTDDCARWDRFWTVSQTEIAMHKSDMADGVLDAPLPGILGWPGSGNPHFELLQGFSLPIGDLAPFFDRNSDGIYDPLDGDFPHPSGLDTSVVPGQILWCLFNDLGGKGSVWEPHHPLGFEYQTTLWALVCGDDDLLNNAFFISQKITNKTGAPMDSVAVAMVTAFAIGSDFDDYKGTAPALASVYGYNEDALDGSANQAGLGLHPPCMALTYLNYPLYKSINFIDGGACDPAPPMYAPSAPEQYFNFLHGRWRDGSPLIFGNDGHFSPSWNPGLPMDYIFPDLPFDDNGWSMFWSHLIGFGICRKMVPSVLLGLMLPGDTRTVDMVYSYHRDTMTDHLGNVARMVDRLGELRQGYAQGFANACSLAICSDDCVWPGDANRDGVANHVDFVAFRAGAGTKGPTRSGVVTWAPHDAEDWPPSFGASTNFKHLDANGDGVIGDLDVNVLLQHHNQSVPGYKPPADTIPLGSEIKLVTSQSVEVNPGQLRSIRSMLSDTIPGLYGVAYTCVVDTNYWQIIGPASSLTSFRWLEPHTAVQHVAFVTTDPTGTIPAGNNLSAITLYSKAPPSGFPDTTLVYLKNIKGYRLDGTEVPLGAVPIRFCFSGGNCPPVVSVEEATSSTTLIYPNPASGDVIIKAPGNPIRRVTVFDATGQMLMERVFADEEMVGLTLAGLPSGLVFLRVEGIGDAQVEKVVLRR